MKKYKIFQHPANKLEAVKEGWSWPGFLFGPFWAFFKKLWGIGTGLLITMIILSLFPVNPDSGLYWLSTIILLVLYIVCGINGNKWRESNLTARSYDHVDTVSASNPDGAIALHVKEKQPSIS